MKRIVQNLFIFSIALTNIVMNATQAETKEQHAQFQLILASPFNASDELVNIQRQLFSLLEKKLNELIEKKDQLKKFRSSRIVALPIERPYFAHFAFAFDNQYCFVEFLLQKLNKLFPSADKIYKKELILGRSTDGNCDLNVVDNIIFLNMYSYPGSNWYLGYLDDEINRTCAISIEKPKFEGIFLGTIEFATPHLSLSELFNTPYTDKHGRQTNIAIELKTILTDKLTAQYTKRAMGILKFDTLELITKPHNRSYTPLVRFNFDPSTQKWISTTLQAPAYAEASAGMPEPSVAPTQQIIEGERKVSRAPAAGNWTSQHEAVANELNQFANHMIVGQTDLALADIEKATNLVRAVKPADLAAENKDGSTLAGIATTISETVGKLPESLQNKWNELVNKLIG